MASEKFNKWWNNLKKTGDICPIKLGYSPDQVKSHLGEPDDFSTGKPSIWKYDEVEFHFTPKPYELYLIYMDTPEGYVRLSITRLD